ncbi:hypothetical protein M501DRAFT_1005144 [Patellaria atrata CBS 101060]|uniref:Uncharacterized protein n=1 Tax=Patellaria atrata CBS 101060 TaxID=1346257 RepID=A0A9P4VQY5_9PEZI|nr:hypothetical protein M501DRAFT_1005144 [Patellaria atrata CBS 101060]
MHSSILDQIDGVAESKEGEEGEPRLGQSISLQSSPLPVRRIITPTPFRPTCTFHINTHPRIFILDLTPYITESYERTPESFKEQAYMIARFSPPYPAYYGGKTNIPGSRIRILRAATNETVAEWKMRNQKIYEPVGWVHKQDNPPDNTLNWAFSVDTFTDNGITFAWETNWDVNSRYGMTLFKHAGETTTLVGKLWRQPLHATSGFLILNSNNVEDVVGIWTCVMAMQRYSGPTVTDFFSPTT